MFPSRDIARLVAIMARLRDPDSGCPWDMEQDFATIAPYTIEEAYEVADAIDRRDMADLRDELGDLLLQVVFHARLARGGRRLRVRRRRAGNHRQAGPPPPARVRRRTRPHGRRARPVGADQGRGEAGARAGSGRTRVRALRRAADASRPHPRAQTAGEGRHGRLRLERSALPFSPRSVRKRTRSRPTLVRRAGRAHRGARGSAVRGRQSRRHLGADPEARCGANGKFERRFGSSSEKLAAAGGPGARPRSAEMDGLWDEAKANEAPNGKVPRSGTSR